MVISPPVRVTRSQTGKCQQPMQKAGADTETLSQIHRDLGIDPGYALRCGLPSIPEGANLVAAGTDVFGRDVIMDAATLVAWQGMQSAASEDAVALQLVSAYRSVDYQKVLFEKKLQAGKTIMEILQVNAAPGYSEHHSGRALDIGCPGFPHLEECFEKSDAFAWLVQHAGSFGFSMSYPRQNTFGVLYEPWHWCYLPGEKERQENKSAANSED